MCVVTVSEEFLEDTVDFSRALGPGSLDLEGAIRNAPKGARVHVTSGHGIEYAVYQLVIRTRGSADWKPMPEAMIRQGRDGGLGVAPRTRSECEAWREAVFPASDVEFGMLNTSTNTIEPLTARA